MSASCRLSAGDAAPRPPVAHRTVDYGVCVRREREILRTMSTYHACLITVWPVVLKTLRCVQIGRDVALRLFVCAQGNEAGPARIAPSRVDRPGVDRSRSSNSRLEQLLPSLGALDALNPCSLHCNLQARNRGRRYESNCWFPPLARRLVGPVRGSVEKCFDRKPRAPQPTRVEAHRALLLFSRSPSGCRSFESCGGEQHG